MGEKRDRERAARLAETNSPNTDGAPTALGTEGKGTGRAKPGGAGSHTATATRSAKPPTEAAFVRDIERKNPGSLAQDHRVTSPNTSQRIPETDREALGEASEGKAQPKSHDGGKLSETELRELRLANLRPTMFQPGNPGAMKGYRKKLAGDFVRELHRDFNEHGAAAIAKCRTQRPAEYVRIIASLLPKQIDIRESDLADTDDDALESFLALARSALLRGGEAGSGAGAETIEGSARVLPSLPEAI